MEIEELKKLYLNKIVDVTIDRPIFSKHPKFGFEYQLNYGYIPNTISGDGEELDVYIIDVNQPLQSCKGKVIAIIHRLNDNDDKLVVSCNNQDFTIEEIILKTHFQEQFFNIVVLK